MALLRLGSCVVTEGYRDAWHCSAFGYSKLFHVMYRTGATNNCCITLCIVIRILVECFGEWIVMPYDLYVLRIHGNKCLNILKWQIFRKLPSGLFRFFCFKVLRKFYLVIVPVECFAVKQILMPENLCSILWNKYV